MSQIRVGIVTNIIPGYRIDFYKRLLADEKLTITIFCQSHIPGTGLVSVRDALTDCVVRVPFWSLGNEVLTWQFIPWACLRDSGDVFFFLGNPRTFSNVVYSALLKRMGKKIVIWGQGHTAGANPLMEKFRLLWWRLFDYFFVYTDREADLLKGKGFDGKVVVGMNNGLDQDAIDIAASSWSSGRLENWRREENLEGRCMVLSCARLEEKNRFDEFLETLPVLVNSMPKLLWCVAGDGRLSEELKSKAEKLNMGKYIRWLGSIYGEDELAPWFLSSRLMVHPGAIGLSLLHAFGYGLPVVTHNDASLHMPEFAAFAHEKNGLMFQRGDSAAMAEQVMKICTDDSLRERLAREALDTARNGYNTRVMTERFASLARLCATDNQ